jgi:hypothetical protein
VLWLPQRVHLYYPAGLSEREPHKSRFDPFWAELSGKGRSSKERTLIEENGDENDFPTGYDEGVGAVFGEVMGCGEIGS